MKSGDYGGRREEGYRWVIVGKTAHIAKGLDRRGVVLSLFWRNYNHPSDWFATEWLVVSGQGK